MNRLLAILLVGCSLSACQKNDNVVTVQPIDDPPSSNSSGTYAGVDESLWPYFQRFEQEGRERGLDININDLGITGEISVIGEGHVAGQCTYSSHHPNHVTIDEEFWERASDLYREFVIFHELGHCYLFRDHRETATANGRCISIMRSGLGDCQDYYLPTTRDIYIDELFAPNQFQ
ncbi:MAG: hypothetical protein AAFP19_10070 [Bacteroidota bacterium]